MSLYFSYRTPFNTPISKFTKNLDAKSILEWFQKIWDSNLKNEELYKFCIDQFGTHFYGLSHFAWNKIEKKIPKPESVEDLLSALKSTFYINNLKIEEESFLEVLTDDDEYSLAWYLVEEKYAKTDLKRFAYLLHENWELPLSYNSEKSIPFDFKFQNIISPSEKRKGELYFVSVCNNFGDVPICYNPTKIEGIRLTDLKHFLLDGKLNNPNLPEELFYYMILLKERNSDTNEILIHELEKAKKEIQNLHQLYYSEFQFNLLQLSSGINNAKIEFEKLFQELQELENNYPHLKTKRQFLPPPIFNGNEHFIQIAIPTENWDNHPVDTDVENSIVYDQIFIFDDLWVNENYHLAYSMLNYYTKWNI